MAASLDGVSVDMSTQARIKKLADVSLASFNTYASVNTMSRRMQNTRFGCTSASTSLHCDAQGSRRDELVHVHRDGTVRELRTHPSAEVTTAFALGPD
eukprot:4913971-Pleurochrysis_carterae.AAC.3